MRSALWMVLALATTGCSTNGAASGDADGGEDAGMCGPAPESLAVSGDDCVASSPNPCCAGFTLFQCSGDAGTTCSETTSCVRAARYDQSVCNGGLAFSCPQLNGGEAFATLTTPGCAQADMVPQNGEGLRWCCGGSGITIPVPDAGPGPGPDGGTTPPVDGGKDSGGSVSMDSGGGMDSGSAADTGGGSMDAATE